jgi:site-specific recombinase XerD
MDVVYLFYENDKIRIPLLDYDEELLRNLITSGFGYWDQLSRQYIIPRKKETDINMKSIISNRTFVEVNRGQNTPEVVNYCFLSGTTGIRRTGNSGPHDYFPLRIDKEQDKFSDEWLGKLEAELCSRKYSPNTRAAYIHYNQALCKWLQKTPEEVTSEDIKRYMVYEEITLGFSASSMNLSLSAFKFFYRNILKKDTAREQCRPRHDRRLPVVFSRSEIKSIFDTEKNIKKRLLLMIVYASGLRVCEVVRLKRQDVDIARKLIVIHLGKGRKDRLTLLADAAISALIEYYSCYPISTWIFPGAGPNSHLSIRSAQRICETALKKAGIAKNASIHSLRHTFATHLLENGTDIRYIQELLGHSSLRTTERYTHVAARKALKITSPIDTLNKPD